MRDVQATIIIDIAGKTEEEILDQADRSRRKNIAKAKEAGLIFKEADEKEWTEYYRIYSKVWIEGGVNPEPLDKLKNTVNYKLFVVKKDSSVIGGGLIEEFNEGINFVAFASSIEYQEYRVNDFLYWNSILWAISQKKKFVDLGGYQLNPQGHMQGINTFKQKWGGKIVMREVKGSIFYIIGRKAIRRFPFLRWIWDRLKRRPVSKKDKVPRKQN